MLKIKSAKFSLVYSPLISMRTLKINGPVSISQAEIVSSLYLDLHLLGVGVPVGLHGDVGGHLHGLRLSSLAASIRSQRVIFCVGWSRDPSTSLV